MNVRENLEAVLLRIEASAIKAGRSPESVRLVAVTKTKPVELIKAVTEAGQLDLGENRVQELMEKVDSLPEARWHLIGSLQRNKVKYIAPFIYLIHSVDSAELLAEISRRAVQNKRVIPCLLQINISGEAQKGGLEEDEAEKLLEEMEQFPGAEIRGLMGMAEFTDNEQVIREQFRRLRLASERYKPLEGERVKMRELSMGMSGDFEIAIAEGATLVRVGSSIFGGR